MRIRLWHKVSVLLLLAQMNLTSCSSSGEPGEVNENLATEGDENAAQTTEGDEESQTTDESNTAATNDGAAEPNFQSGENQGAAEGEEPAQGENAAAADTPVAENQGAESQPAENAPVAAGDGSFGGQGDLQEIIEEMNQTAESPTKSTPEPQTSTPAPSANLVETGDGTPTAPSPAGLPEMGSKMAYIVQKGDTLAAIASKVYGDSSKWSEIQTFTNLTNPRLIYPGDIVYYQLTEQTMTFASAYETVQRSQVKVQQGDTLSTIAGRVLGSSSNWKLIWRQNDNIENPDALAPGSTLYYVAPAALSAAVDDLKIKMAEAKKDVVRVIAKNVKKSIVDNFEFNTEPVSTDAASANSVDNEIESDFLSVDILDATYVHAG